VYGEKVTWGPDGTKYFDGKFEFLGYERYPKFNNSILKLKILNGQL
jgi:hypothetical protein